MSVTLPLDSMTTREKLEVMETLWDDLCRNSDALPSPEWHGEALREREAMIREGRASFLDLDEIKGQIDKGL